MNRLFAYIKQPLWDSWYVGEKIGQGTYSEVYKIYAGNRTSALKVKPVFADSADVLKRKIDVAEREAVIMEGMKECPYIVEYQGKIIQKISELQYLVMIRTEILRPLYGMFFAENIVRKIAIDIGKALEYIHSAGVVHGDVKPDNFFVSGDGKYKIGDFNVSDYSGTSRYFSGTSGYTAPEIYNGSIYDIRSDIYSFGKSLAGFTGDISPDFSAIIEKACAYRLCDRYQNVGEMLDDISALDMKHYVGPEDLF